MAKVNVKINTKSGEVTYEVEGVVGGSCTDITQALVAANNEVETQFTSEYCMTEDLPDFVEEQLDAYTPED